MARKKGEKNVTDGIFLGAIYKFLLSVRVGRWDEYTKNMQIRLNQEPVRQTTIYHMDSKKWKEECEKYIIIYTLDVYIQDLTAQRT